MAKVVYSISKVNRDWKITGVGSLSEDGSLWTKTKSGKWRPPFEDVLKYCHPIAGRPNEFSGYMTVAYENVPVYDKDKDNYRYVDYMEIEYRVWFKYLY